MTKTRILEIRADDKFVEALSELCTRTNKSRAEVIRDALNFYEKALTEWEERDPDWEKEDDWGERDPDWEKEDD